MIGLKCDRLKESGLFTDPATTEVYFRPTTEGSYERLGKAQTKKVSDHSFSLRQKREKDQAKV